MKRKTREEEEKKNVRMWADNLQYFIVIISFLFPIKYSCYVPDFLENEEVVYE